MTTQSLGSTSPQAPRLHHQWRGKWRARYFCPFFSWHYSQMLNSHELLWSLTTVVYKKSSQLHRLQQELLLKKSPKSQLEEVDIKGTFLLRSTWPIGDYMYAMLNSPIPGGNPQFFFTHFIIPVVSPGSRPWGKQMTSALLLGLYTDLWGLTVLPQSHNEA